MPHTPAESEVAWRSVYEHALEGVLLTVPDGRILAANPAACALLGRTEVEICQAGRAGVVELNEAAARLVAERDRAGWARGQITFRRKDGTTFLAEVSSAIFTDANGARRTSMSFRDVTESERARQTLEILAEAGRVFGASLDIQATLNGLTGLVVPRLADVCTVDLMEAGEIRRVAVSHRDPARMKAFFGVRRGRASQRAAGGVDLVLRTGEPTSVFAVTDEWLRMAAHDEQHYQAARALGLRSFVSTPLIARGRTIGALTLMSVGGVPAFSEADLPFVRALAERAALAIDNAREHRDALESRRLRDEVLGIVSHDLRNPLNAILLAASALELKAPNPQLLVIKRAVRHADRLIQDLLAAARAQAGSLQLDRREETVASILEDVRELNRALAEASAITLAVTAEEGLGRLNVDRHRIVQLLNNLVGNALKFTPSGGRVELRAGREGEAVRLSVSDTGPGIPGKDLPHVFDRFWQGAQLRHAGAGLGLAIARGIAEAHGGTLSVESRVGEGATFTVVLPREGGAGGSDAAP